MWSYRPDFAGADALSDPHLRFQSPPGKRRKCDSSEIEGVRGGLKFNRFERTRHLKTIYERRIGNGLGTIRALAKNVGHRMVAS
jgi:hypothetical protein